MFPKFSIPRYIFLCGAIGCSLVLFQITQKRDFSLSANDTKHFAFFYLIPLVAIGLFCLIMFIIKRNIHLLALILCLSFVIPFYAFELYLQYRAHNLPGLIEASAKKQRYPFDQRSIKEVTMDLRAQGVNAYPFFLLTNEFKKIMPLSNIPNVRTVSCNEMGQHHIFTTDRYGFNNPDEEWNHRQYDAVFIGDSFTHGSCMPGNEHIFPKLVKSNFKHTLNLGISGNEPWTDLATITEFIPHIKPRYTFWVHYAGNDLSGLMVRTGHRLLTKYLYEDYFSQDLFHKQKDVADELLTFYNDHSAEIYQQTENRTPWDRLNIEYTTKLYFLRASMGMTRDLSGGTDFALFEAILSKAKSICERAHSQLIFVHIMNASQALDMEKDVKQKATLAVAAKLNLPIVNFADALQKLPNSADAFAWGKFGGHLTPLGHDLLADHILQNVPTVVSHK